MKITFIKDVTGGDKNSVIYKAFSVYDVSDAVARKWIAAGDAKEGVHQAPTPTVSRARRSVLPVELTDPEDS